MSHAIAQNNSPGPKTKKSSGYEIAGVTQEQFGRYVNPQLKNMLTEFFYALKKNNSVQEDITQMRNQILELNLLWKKYKNICPKMSEECDLPLIEVYQQLRKIDFSLSEIQLKKIKLKGHKNQADVDTSLQLIADINSIAHTAYQLTHQMEELIATINTGYYYNKPHPDLFPALHKMLISSEFIMTSQVDLSFRKEIEFIWENFFKIVEQKMLLEGDARFFNSNYEDLNMVWNSFHMRMSKSSLPVDREIVVLFEQMHNRWNGILRTMLD